MRLPAVLVALVLFSPLASAGSAEAPEATDPAGDAGPNGVAAPAGHEDVDIVAIWFEGETLATVDLVMQLAGPQRSRPNTLWATTFDVKGTSKAAGYGDFGAFGSQTFLCDYAEGNDVSNCVTVTGAFSGNALRVTLPRENLSEPAAGDAATITGAVTFSIAFVPAPPPVPPLGQSVNWDVSPAGMPYLFEKGAAALNETLPGANSTLPRVNTTISPAAGGAANVDGEAQTPAAPAVAAVAALAAVALALRRKR